MVIEITGTLVIDEAAREWCKLPYPNHPKGCPNYGVRDTCPPKIKRIAEVFDLSRPHFFILVEFDLASHVAAMAKKHPNWTDRQCRCVLYWQGKPRSKLKKESKKFVENNPGTSFTTCPEAMGINVFRTCHKHGLMMKKNPQKTVYKISFVGYPYD